MPDTSSSTISTYLAVCLGAGLLSPMTARGSDDADVFLRRFEDLAKRGVIEVGGSARPQAGLALDPPAHTSSSSGGSDDASRARAPELISREGIRAVLVGRRDLFDACLAGQSAMDPPWSGSLILDLGVRRTGRVAEVSVEPEAAARSPVGQCLLRNVPKLRFPEFTGEAGEGITREVINASFALRFHSAGGPVRRGSPAPPTQHR